MEFTGFFIKIFSSIFCYTYISFLETKISGNNRNYNDYY